MNYGAINGYQMNDAQQMSDALTGNYCFTTDMWGNLILWVEVSYVTKEDEPWTTWRKARVYDLPKLKIIP